MKVHIKKHLLTGIILLLPAAITLSVVNFIVKLLTHPFEGFAKALLSHCTPDHMKYLLSSSDEFLHYTVLLLILLIVFFTTILIGILTRWFLMRSILKVIDRIFEKIPFINKIYSATQDVVQSIFTTQTTSFKRVVLAPFPNSSILSIGFVTREHSPNDDNTPSTPSVSVFIPGTPNPTMGFILIFKSDQLIFLDMKVDEALKYIMSCGVMLPNPTALKKKNF